MRGLFCFTRSRSANNQHAQTPTTSAGAADPPHRGEGMGANDLNYKSETPADPLPPVGYRIHTSPVALPPEL